MVDSDLGEKANVSEEERGPDITRDEFDFGVSNIKNGKAAGYDHIFIEVINKPPIPMLMRFSKLLKKFTILEKCL